MKFKRWSVLAPFFLFVLVSIVYIHNISPGVYGGDAGDFLSAIAVKGVAHPSGYPLFTLLGIVFSYLPIGSTLAWKVGLVSSIFSSVAVLLMYLLIQILTKNRILSIITSLILAFFYPFWLYAEVAEVFALHNFLLLLILLVSVCYYKIKKTYLLYVITFLVGLSLTNNHFIILIFPSIFLIVLFTNWRVFLNIKTLVFCFLSFLLGLAPYIYVPLSASKGPVINWDNAVNIDNFIRLVLRLDYGKVEPNTNVSSYIRFLSLKMYFNYLYTQLTPPVLFLSVLGIKSFFDKKGKILPLSIFLAFFLTGPFFIVFASPPLLSRFNMGIIERFYMVSGIILLIFFPFGLNFVIETILKYLRKVSVNFARIQYKYLFYSTFIVIPYLLFSINFSRTDLHSTLIGDNLAQDLLAPLPKNSILLIQGDTVLFNTLYVQLAKGYRKDVTLVNLGGLSGEKKFLKNKEELYRKNKKMAEDKLNILALLNLGKDKPLFSLINIQYKDKNSEKLHWIPYGLVLKFADAEDKNLTKDEFIKQQKKIWESFSLPKERKNKKVAENGLTVIEVPLIYSSALINTANYLLSEFKDNEKVKDYYQEAINMTPNEELGYTGMGYYYLNKKECKKAEENLKRAISLDPLKKVTYILLYATYDSCLKSKGESKKIAEEYYNLFREPITKEIDRKLKGNI